jgi:hypothetical protein
MGVDQGGGGVNVTFKITTALTTVGSILVPVGILVLIVGAVLKRGGSKPAPAPMAVPEPTPTAPESPP